MKVLRISLLMLLLVIMFVSHWAISVFAKENLDEIEQYTITSNVREDGTLDLKYYIEWKVLDSESEGPLEWVKIGIPNKHVDSITPLTNSIKSAEYYADGGSFVRLDLDRKYQAGETVIMEFTIHQGYMYMLDDDNIKYSFTAGWFDKIIVKSIEIRWNSNWVAESTASEVSLDGKYLIWKGSLAEGEHFSTSVKYPKNTFATNENEQFVEGHDKDSSGVLLTIIIIGGIILVFVIIVIENDDYNGGNGFKTGGKQSTYVSSCVRSSCACVSCACACACAGGGRAGCSVKELYHGQNIRNDEKNDSQVTLLIKVLSEKVIELK